MSEVPVRKLGAVMVGGKEIRRATAGSADEGVSDDVPSSESEVNVVLSRPRPTLTSISSGGGRGGKGRKDSILE